MTKRKSSFHFFYRRGWLILFLYLLMTTSSAQNKVPLTERKLTFSVKDEKLKNVLNIIKKQLSINIFRKKSKNLNDLPVNLTVKDEPLPQVLDQLFKGTKLTWEIIDGSIVINNRITVTADKDSLIVIRGIITDHEGTLLPGVNVIAEGSANKTLTDANGKFKIPVNPGITHLQLRCIGFKDQRIPIKGKIFVKMYPSESSLPEVEVVGYGTINRGTNTGNISRISDRILSKQSVDNPAKALAGTTPGLFAAQNSGLPGGGVNIRIRGQKSLEATNDVLFVVDGVPYLRGPVNTSGIGPYETIPGNSSIGISPLEYLNSADIVSIDVLKDADATAIYGSRGANGVILITTRGAKEDPLRINVTSYAGFERVTRRMKLCNTQQYLQMRREAKKNDDAVNEDFDDDINGTWDETQNIDRQKELIGGTAHVHDIQLSISAGKPKLQYHVSSAHHSGTSVFPGTNTNERTTLHANVIASSFKGKLKTSLSVNAALGKMVLIGKDLTNDAIKLSPNAPALFDSNGKLNWGPDTTYNNPASYINRPYENKVHNLISNLQLSYDILDGLSFKTNLGFVHNSIDETSKRYKTSFNPIVAKYMALQTIFGTGKAESSLMESQLNYQHKWGKFNLNGLAGTTLQHEFSSQLKQTASGFENIAQMNNINAAIQSTIKREPNYSEYKYASMFGRAGLNWDDKYFVNLSGRRDASSRFGNKKRAGTFSAIGVGWIFSQERFMKEYLPWLSFAKLRASYGTTGNDQIPDYEYLTSYTTVNVNQYQGVQGITPSRPENPGFRWEVNRKEELGIELSFLKMRISFSTSYFRNRSTNQLIAYSLPPSTGFQSIQYNLDAVVQNTGLEMELKSINIQKEFFSWTSSFNLTVPRNKLISFPGLDRSTYVNRYVVGQPLDIERLYTYIGVDPQTGIHKVKDVDGNNKFDENDKQSFGNSGPVFYGGSQHTISYKFIHLDFLLQFVKQSGKNYLYNTGLPGLFNQNQPVNILNRWQTPGTTGAANQQFSSIAGGSAGQAYDLYVNSDRLFTDASYIRLKYVSLSFQIEPKPNRLKIKEAVIFVRAQNLLTITNYMGLDPENKELGLPPLKTITAGFSVTFK